ncbi:VPLPA-CTERM sorting domain-containing protein [Hyphococcus luteus]|uniref:PEP-CTERM protein-sorting domain-containing protein n=1 Tax=Hyphococcus luteus TaxID=2058213 RepID=A0A2S7K2U0_9PROT|nr:VPLPA-CTERM sorting domain-containing protein [Marinicaulis flavus]PQA86820.1 hypothetical protein CW354_15170 [Marinicaulis flavus]
MFRSALFVSTALAALGFSTSAAFADCTPDSPGGGDTVTCASDDADGLEDGSDNVTVNINAGVTVSNPGGDAIKLKGDANIINNDGALDGDDEGVQIEGANSEVRNNSGASIAGGDRGVQIEGDGTILTNAAGATITGGDRGVEAEDADNVEIYNSGLIEGEDKDGVRAGSGAIIQNNAGATILAGDDGVQIAGDGATITNNGTISALVDQGSGGSSEGITGDDDITLINHGTLEADDDAFQTQLNANVTNTGTIRSINNDGIDIDTGAIVNSGTIIAEGVEDGVDYDAGVDPISISTIDNQAGGVVGVNVDAGNDARQFVTNAGTITGTGGTALFLEEGEDSLTMLGTGVINGVADLGEDDDLLTVMGPQLAAVGGGNLFDGGADIDTIAFDEIASDDLISLTVASLASTLTFRNSDDTVSTLLFANFEYFSLTDGIFSVEEFASAVPVPAAGFLFAGGLGLFGFLRRRARPKV